MNKELSGGGQGAEAPENKGWDHWEGFARAIETADEQTTEMVKQQSNAVGYGRNKATDVQQKENYRGLPKSGLRNNRCGLCVGNYPHQGTCPAQGNKCLNCGKMNHFSKVCSANPIIGPNLRTRRNRQKVNTTPGLQMLKSLRVRNVIPNRCW